MNDIRSCNLCGKTGQLDNGKEKPREIYYCAIGCHLVCANCIDWSASGKGYHEVCKECSSKYVLYDRQISLFYGEPRFFDGERFIFSLDRVELYLPEHLVFLKEKEGQFPMTVKDAIFLQLNNIIPFLEECDEIDEITNEYTDAVLFAEGKMDIICRCGENYTAHFTWEDKDDTEFGEYSSDPCPKCGQESNKRIYMIRKDLSLGMG